MAERKVRVDGAMSKPTTQTVAAPQCVHPSASQAATQSVPEPHRLERFIMHELRSVFSFSSLVVRQTPDGVYLQGVVYCDEDAPDVTSTAQRIAGVERVINQLVTVRESPNEQTRKPPK